MALKLLFKAAEAKVPVVLEVEKTKAELLAQEYVGLHEIYDQLGMKKHLSRMEEIRKSLQSIANEDGAPGEPVVFECEGGSILFSPRTEVVTVLDPQSLLDYLAQNFGVAVALGCVKWGITELKKVLTPLEMDQFTGTKEGSRTLKAVILK